MTDAERDDDGLPLDPTARAAAVAAQFDEHYAFLKRLDEREARSHNENLQRNLGFTADDSLRLVVARELVNLGVQVDSLRSLFDSLETASSPRTKPWPWVHTEDARRQGATLVLFRPVRASACGIGAACVTTAAQAVEWLRTKRAVTVIDIGAILARMEQAAPPPEPLQ